VCHISRKGRSERFERSVDAAGIEDGFAEGNTMSTNVGSTGVRIVVTVLLLGCGLGVPAYGFAGGTGEPNNPYQIAPGV
jgi:hypothetical protein